MNALQPFHAISADPLGYARQWKRRSGRPVIGSLCSYAPDELILAARALGIRILGQGHAIAKADAHIQAYGCNLVRGALEDALAGELDFIDGMIFPHTCDSIQRLSDIWRLDADTGFHLDALMPVKLNTASARAYMVDVIGKLRSDLETALGRSITEADVAGAIDVTNQIRRGLQTLYECRRDDPGAMRGADLYAILRAATVMDREDFLHALTALLAELTSRPGPTDTNSKRILLSGGVCQLPDIYTIVEDAGGAVVWDDLCTGSRHLLGCTDSQQDPIHAIAQRYANRLICPAKHAGITRRGDELVRLASQTRAHGVIFLFLKFCDPHAFDYPYLKQMLAEQHIDCLMLEWDGRPQADGQLKTRCEAFMEML